ncbi:MAG: hypothetical protein ABIH86_04025 [Planctomycetota bacterium]
MKKADEIILWFIFAITALGTIIGFVLVIMGIIGRRRNTYKDKLEGIIDEDGWEDDDSSTKQRSSKNFLFLLYGFVLLIPFFIVLYKRISSYCSGEGSLLNSDGWDRIIACISMVYISFPMMIFITGIVLLIKGFLQLIKIYQNREPCNEKDRNWQEVVGFIKISIGFVITFSFLTWLAVILRS